MSPCTPPWAEEGDHAAGVQYGLRLFIHNPCRSLSLATATAASLAAAASSLAAAASLAAEASLAAAAAVSSGFYMPGW